MRREFDAIILNMNEIRDKLHHVGLKRRHNVAGAVNAGKQNHCKGVNESFTPSAGGLQKKNYIPEGDLYHLIIRSKLPALTRFEAWVFDTVLPSIRKFGAYIMLDMLEEMVTSPDFAINPCSSQASTFPPFHV